MKKSEIITLYNGLSSIKELSGSVKFAYAIIKNLKDLEPTVEVFKELAKPTEEYQAFETERMELVKKHAEKDEAGEPLVKDNSYTIKDVKAFEKEFTKLKEKHQEALDENEQKNKEIEELLQEEVTVNLHKIATDILPDMTPSQLEAIYPIIEE